MISKYRISHWRQLLLAALAILLLAFPVSAQVFSRFFAHYEGGDVEYAYSIVESERGIFTVCGQVGAAVGGQDACLMQLDPGGNPLWTLTYGGSGSESGQDLILMPDSGFVLVGETYSFGNGQGDVFVVRTDAVGAVLWARAVGGTNSELGTSVIRSSDGGIVVAGYTRSFGVANYDIYVFKLDSGGNLLWTRTIGGGLNDFAYEVVQTSDGGYAVGGFTNSFGAGNVDMLLVRLDASGNVLNVRTYGGPGNDAGYGLIGTSDDGLMIYGYTNGFGAGAEDGILIKTDRNGNIAWARTYGTAAMNRIFHVVETSPGQFVATGETTTSTFGAGDQQVFKIDATGNLIWARHSGTAVDETGYGAAIATQDGGILMTGWDDNAEDMLLNKMDSLGDSGCNSAPISLTVGIPSLNLGTGGTNGTGGSSLNASISANAYLLEANFYCSNVLAAHMLSLEGFREHGFDRLAWQWLGEQGFQRAWLEQAKEGEDFAWERDLSGLGGTLLLPATGACQYRIAWRGAGGDAGFSEVLSLGSPAPGLRLRVQNEDGQVQHLHLGAFDASLGYDWDLLDLHGRIVAHGSEMGADARLHLPTGSAGGMQLLRCNQNGRQAVFKLVW